jgi:hypothetical protein
MYDDNGVPLFRNGNGLGKFIANISRPYNKEKPQPHHGDIKVYKPDSSGALILDRVVSIIKLIKDREENEKPLNKKQIGTLNLIR